MWYYVYSTYRDAAKSAADLTWKIPSQQNKNGVPSTKHGNSEQVPSLVSCSPFKTNKQTKNFKHFEIFIKNILLWLKGTEILEDGPVNPWTVNAPSKSSKPNSVIQ